LDVQEAKRYADRFERLMTEFVRKRQQHRAGNGHPPRSQFALLTVLDRGSSSVAELAEALEVTSPAASNLVSELVKSGWAERGEHPQDRRVKLITLTKEGKRVLAKARREHRTKAISALQHFDSQEIEIFLQTIRKFHEIIQ
jgi:DNA-binding MarR family transcriptional regulator